MNIFVKSVLFILSPTMGLACIVKDKFDRTKTIKSLNWLYLSARILIVIFFWGFSNTRPDYESQSYYPSIILGVYLWSRSFEILAAFIIDAIDKTKPIKPSSSDLSPKDRIVLSLKSYIELIIIFGVGFWIMPTDWWSNAPNSIFSSIYYSGVTITTLGYGDVYPIHIIPQILSVYEVLCGFSLIVVSFAIYTGLEYDENK